MNISKLRYIAKCVWSIARRERVVCPFCGGMKFERIDSKWGLVELRECAECALLYRVPTDSAQLSEEFYQDEYEGGETTRLPGCEELQRLRQANFGDFGRSYARYIAMLRCLGVEEGAHILDFGASWGYGVHQFREAGFRAAGFEISRSRSAFGRRELDLTMLNTLDGIEGRFDVFFSSHVLEHLSDLREVLATARRVTRAGGWFVAVTPNGSVSFRRAAPPSFHKLWGFVHPILIQETFIQKVFASDPHFVSSDLASFANLREWDGVTSQVGDLAGWELFVAARLAGQGPGQSVSPLPIRSGQ